MPDLNLKFAAAVTNVHAVYLSRCNMLIIYRCLRSGRPLHEEAKGQILFLSGNMPPFFRSYLTMTPQPSHSAAAACPTGLEYLGRT